MNKIELKEVEKQTVIEMSFGGELPLSVHNGLVHTSHIECLAETTFQTRVLAEMATIGLINDRVNGPIKLMIISTSGAAFL